MVQRRYTEFDVIRLAAFILLLTCHATDPFIASVTYGNSGAVVEPTLAAWGARWGAFARPCVPLFVMLTGALLLPVRQEMGAFYKKRIGRVLWPFLIWSTLYYLTPWFTGLLGLDSGVVYKLFSWAESDSQSLSDSLINVVRIPYHFSLIACHMWYIYLLIGIYLYLPVFSAWVEKATKRQKEVFLGIWVLTTFLPYFTEFVSHYSFGTCEWNAFGTFYYFAGFNGYLLLGHYLHTYVKADKVKSIAFGLPALVIGYLICLKGYQHIMAMETQTPEQVELFWTYCTPNVAVMTVAWFMMLRCVRPAEDGHIGRLLANLTSCGFGIYMIHYFFVRVGYLAANALHLPVALKIPGAALTILLVSWAIVATVKRLMGKSSRWLLG